MASAATGSDGSKPAPPSIAHAVTHVPAATLNKVGAGEVLGPPDFTVRKLHGARLEKGGRPELLTADLAWCPHCEADSWALAVALSRFGRLSHLRVIDSGTLFCAQVKRCFPHTRGLSFFKAGFASSHLSFASIVLQDLKGHKLQTPTSRESTALGSFDSGGIVPVIDVGGRYGFVSSGVSPGVLRHETESQIANALSDPRSTIAKQVDGLANLFSAAICHATRGRPARVCKSRGVSAASMHLP